MAISPDQLDTHIEIITPENIGFQYRVAGPFQRLPAYLIDLFLQLAIVTAVSLVVVIFTGLVGMMGLGAGFGVVFYFLVSWFYRGFFESMWNGQTPGKRLMNLRVLTDDGQPINGLQAVLRNILRAVDLLPGTYLLAFIASFWSDRFARLGDLACGTMVIVEEPRYAAGALAITEPEALELAGRLPARLTFPQGVAAALSSYVGRRRVLPWARRVQIARHLGEPLRERFNLPAGVSYDLLLCALYHRIFFADLVDDVPQPAPVLAVVAETQATSQI
jgi:uncharacterized RDD family membrane protein YckC